MRGKARRTGPIGRRGRWRGADDPARRRGRGIVGGRCAQQNGKRAALRRGERQPPHRHRVDDAVPPLADHRAHRAAAQRLLHRPQQIARPRRGDRQQALGGKAESFKTAAMRRTAFGERHVLGDPAHAGVFTCGEPQREPRRRREMRLACRGDLVQRAARKAAAEHFIDAGNAERKAAGFAEAGGFLQSAQALTQLLDHLGKPLKTRINPAKWQDLPVPDVPYLF